MPSSRRRPSFALLLAATTLLALVAPVAASEPERFTTSETLLECSAVPGSAGTIRLLVGIDATTGPDGLLRFWAAGTDPSTSMPTLVSLGMTATLNPDGSITASFDMYVPGDLGFEGGAEPVFVGTAELTATTEAGDPVRTDRRVQSGNHVFIVRGISQELTVTAGSVEVPTAGTFDLAGGDCAGARKVESGFATQPETTVAQRELVELFCFVETAGGFVFIDAQSGVTDTFVTVIVLDGDAFAFGQALDPVVSLRGVEGTAALPVDGTSLVGTATVSADFDVVQRSRDWTFTPDGWASETEYSFSVDGTITVELPGSDSLELPMNECFAEAQVGMSKAG